MKITIVTTGGTIDKVYVDAKSKYEIGEPQIGDILQEAAVGVEFEIRQLMRKDSLDMTPEDRALIRLAIENDPGGHFVITHGTDTMTETADALRGMEGKVIVLTGSLSPARFHTTDAMFNIGMAIAAAQCMPPGVYITMNGRVFDSSRVRKNRELNRFEPVD